MRTSDHGDNLRGSDDGRTTRPGSKGRSSISSRCCDASITVLLCCVLAASFVGVTVAWWFGGVDLGRYDTWLTIGLSLVSFAGISGDCLVRSVHSVVPQVRHGRAAPSFCLTDSPVLLLVRSQEG